MPETLLESGNITWRIHVYGSLPSTQDYAKELAEEGLEEGVLVQSLIQTKGRGRLGREWDSPMGNLYMSFILRPKKHISEAGQAAFMGALALYNALCTHVLEPEKLRLKWPNDVLYDGKKISGLLIEAITDHDGVLDSMAVGMGVNINSAPEGCASLAEICKDNVPPVHHLRDEILRKLADAYALWHRDGFAPIRAQWCEAGHREGDALTVQRGDKSLKGTYAGLDKTGALLLRFENKLHTIPSGDIIIESQKREF